MDAQTITQRFAFKEYGQVVKVDDPILNKTYKRYIANIRANYPIFIRDDLSPADYEVRVLKIGSLGQITLNEELQIMPKLTTYREECKQNLIKILNLWKAQAENIVVTASSDQLIMIEEFRNHFSQIERLLDHVREYKRIHSIELTKYLSNKEKRKIGRYVNLLVSLDILRFIEENSYYEYGNQYIGIEKELREKGRINEEKLKLAILSYIIKNRYPILRDEFQLTILESTIGIDNVIYLPELELKKSVCRKPDSIASNYKKYYNRNINPLHLTQILKRLLRVGAIRRKGRVYYGDDNLRENMLEQKKLLKPLAISHWYM